MKAVVYARYGPPDVLRLTDVEMPAPKDNEVLVKVHAVSLNRSDWEALRGKPLYSRIAGPFRPGRHILGSDIAGQVEAVGRNATLFQPGDDVFADILSHMGGFAEYVCVPENVLARMPDGRGNRAAGHTRKGTRPARAEGVDQRRRRRLGHVRRTARKAGRGRGHRRGQH